MTTRQVALRLPNDIYRLVDDYMQTTGSTLTEVMVTALATYFHAEDKLPLVERVSRLERRLAALEGMSKKL